MRQSALTPVPPDGLAVVKLQTPFTPEAAAGLSNTPASACDGPDRSVTLGAPASTGAGAAGAALARDERALSDCLAADRNHDVAAHVGLTADGLAARRRRTRAHGGAA